MTETNTYTSGEQAFNMRERKEPKFVNFADGDCIDGVLVSVGRARIEKDGRASVTARYTVDTGEGELVQFLGTHQLNSKLRRGDIGHAISVRCEGTDKNIGKNGNNMKLFKVLVSEKLTPGWSDDKTLITDDDIPF